MDRAITEQEHTIELCDLKVNNLKNWTDRDKNEIIRLRKEADRFPWLETLAAGSSMFVLGWIIGGVKK